MKNKAQDSKNSSLSYRRLRLLGAVFAFIASGLWLASEPAPEPIVALFASFATLIETLSD